MSSFRPLKMPSSNVSVFINISDKEIKKGVDDKEEKKINDRFQTTECTDVIK